MDQVTRCRSASELYFLARNRLPGGRIDADRRLWRRSIKFDAAAARVLEPDDGAVLAGCTAALDTFNRGLALGVKRVLDYPISHHRHLAAVISEEAELQPDFAVTLKGQMLPGELTDRLDAEIELADRIIAFCPAHVRSFVHSGVPEDRLILAPLGVDTDLFVPQHSGRGSSDPFRVVLVGQITQRKGLSYVLRAFETAFGASNEAELLLVGPVIGSSRPWRHFPRVRHIPSLPRGMLPAIYSSADVFVMPSLAEGFGATPLEAMSCGLPVVISDETFGTSVVEDGVDGFIVPTRDSDSIAEILLKLRGDRDLRDAVGARARRRSLEFSWKRFRSQMTAEFAQLMGSRPEAEALEGVSILKTTSLGH